MGLPLIHRINVSLICFNSAELGADSESAELLPCLSGALLSLEATPRPVELLC